MYKSILIFSSLFISVFAFSSESDAQTSKRVQILSAENLSELDSIFNSSNDSSIKARDGNLSKNLANPLKIKISIKGIGRIESNLNKQRHFNINDNSAAFLQGEGLKISGSKNSASPSFATVVNGANGDRLLRLFVVTNSRKNSKRGWSGIAEVRANIKKDKNSFKIDKLSIHRSKKRDASNLNCLGSSHGETDHSQHAHFHSDVSTKAEVQIAKLLVEADLEYENQISNSMPVELATIINGVDTIYQRDLGLSFDTTIADRSTAYTANIEYDQDFNILLHNEMKIVQPAESRGADIHYLFTGKTPVGEDLANLAGVVPDLGTVCKTPVNSIGLTIRIDTATDIVVTAHEIGHLYSAEHDDNFTDPNNPNIMSSVVGGTITSFSSYSMSQISSFVSENGSCLVTGTGTGGGGGGGGGVTLPSTGRLFAFKRNRNFAVEVYDIETDEVYTGYAVSVLYRKRSRDEYTTIKELVTNSSGIASFRPKKRGQYLFQIGDKRSKRLQLR